ncbi:MAG: WG repeat-containing protein [Saprospiraceae bacterium]|nr:WG repeat-containing protein [Saprospiraceae bacterium]
MVKTITGLYGLIDNNGKIIVPANYKSIEKFGKYSNDLALVKTITGKYGFVNKEGKEVVETKYELEEIKRNLYQIYGG